MITRYPHTATITIETVSNDPIPVVTTETLSIRGRYEPAQGNVNLNYKAKYFCEQTPEVLKENPHAFDGQSLQVFGRSITVVKAWPYQSHCEIWLD